MSRILIAMVASALLPMAAHAQQPPSPAPSTKAPASITMTGCVSAKPAVSGQYTFAEADGVRSFRLTGKGLRKFAGKRVELFGGASGDGFAVRSGLWPEVSGGARGVARDPAQESIARQPGGGNAGVGPQYPEFRVSRVRQVAGACE